MHFACISASARAYTFDQASLDLVAILSTVFELPFF